MSDVALVYTTFADAAEAGRIAATVIDERLAACVHLPAAVTAIYRWQGTVERATEAPALFKTTTGLAPVLRARIAELHGHDLPVIETWPVAVERAVFDWIVAETGD